MADESHYSSGIVDAPISHKRKHEEQTTPAPPAGIRRPTGFSSGPIPSASPDLAVAAAAPPPPSYNSVPPPMDEIQMAKQKAQEIAARLLNSADAKRPRVDNGASYDSSDRGFSSGPSDGKPLSGSVSSNIPVSYGSYQGTTKKIEIPNMRVGVIIGKGGETIKYLQFQSGAKIQITRDMDADPNAPTRTVELSGTPDQISKAEQLINDVLQEAEAGGMSRRMTGHAGSEQFVMKVPNNKVGLVIGKGGESIKSMQAKTGARIQVIPLHLPPGDTSTERTIQIDGTSEQIEHAKQLVNEVISGENRLRNPSMGGGYPPQSYQARPPSSWAPPGGPPMRQPGYGYMQPGGYSGPSPQYQSPYGSYPPQQTSSGYPPSQQTPQGGYDYYGQQQNPPSQQQSSGGSAPPTDSSGYDYYQHQSGYGQPGQGYHQDAYGAYNQQYSQAGYDQQQGYSASGYGNPSQEGQTPSYGGGQGDSSQAPPPAGQSGYSSGQQPSPNAAAYPPEGSASTGQAGYGTQPSAHSGYGPGYGGAPPIQKPPPAYGQSQQSPGAPGSYSGQSGYSQPPASGAPSSGYAAAPGPQPGYGPPPTYGQQGYPQAPPPYGSYGGYMQQPAGGDSSDGSAPAGGGGGTPGSQGGQQSGGAKASPKS
ncbi:PREDICTED: far upstream element-binding protein 1-like [Tarenaya hassleriana]|uniref:far upstream element-binding protein 1-like n=1 Tax=Tarenaya hassleriana TaxID=28532 RepID=UPI00053C847E|nr:PREDICTED: far upstream element-binding protein 1-like [Tarenaya hassleriana]